MARIIIGSSNVKRFYSHAKFKSYQPYKMELCTINRMFEVTMESIPDEAKVILSVVENFLEKEITQAKDEDGKKKILTTVMKNFIETVVRVAKLKKKAKFVVAYPLLRPGNKWMIDHDELVTREFEKAFNKQDQANISKVDCLLKGSQHFENDGVHLTRDCGETFLENLLGMAEDSFEAEYIDIDVAEKIQNLGEASTKSNEVSGVAINELRRNATEMREWRDHFERTIDKKFRNDNLMFARLREEMDAEVNRKKEDRTLIAGCVDPALMPRNGKEKNDYLKNLAKDFCKKIIPDFDEEIQFASVSGRPDKGNLMLEFKLGSVERARDFRKVFAQKRIGNELPEGMDKFQVSNVITQATKVRIEIMKAIAKIIDSDSEVGYVPTYLSRPILHIKEKETNSGGSGPGARIPRRHIKSLTFADAIEQFGLRLEERHLTWAYEKASWNFQGQMRQNFVVLADRAVATGSAGPSRGPRGTGSGTWARGGGGRGRGMPETRRGGGTKRAHEDPESDEKSAPKKR